MEIILTLAEFSDLLALVLLLGLIGGTYQLSLVEAPLPADSEAVFPDLPLGVHARNSRQDVFAVSKNVTPSSSAR